MDVKARSIVTTMWLIIALRVGDVRAEEIKIEDVNSDDVHVQNSSGNKYKIKETSKKNAMILEEVFVTATKRSKSLRSLPASISAFKGEDLEKQAILSINDVLEQTPGVTSNSARPGDQRIVMRGISTSSSPVSTVPYPVGIFIGETALNEPYAASITPDLSAFDIASVEILKGPQGTLFGGAALSGVLRYRLTDPSPEEWELRYFAQDIYPEDGSEALTQGVVLNVPLLGEDGDLGMRLAYIDRQYPGVTDDLRSGQTQEDVNEGDGDQLRAVFLWQPADELQLKFSYLDQDYEAENALIIADSPNGPRATSGTLIPWPSKHRFGLYNLEVQYDWESVRFVSSSSRTEKERFNIIDSYGVLLGRPPEFIEESLAVPFITDQESTSFQQELRLQSSGGENFEWLLGAYYLRSPIRYFLKLNVQALNTLSLLLTNDGIQISDLGLGDATGQAPMTTAPGSGNVDCELSVLCAETNALAIEKALFFDMTWKLWDRFELSAGARVYETSVAGGFIGQGAAARAVNGGMSPADFTADITEEGVNPKVSARFLFNDNISVYILANKGFRFGGIQNIPEDEAQNIPATYKSDYIWNYELGLRTSWFDQRLELDITGYHIDYTDALVVLKNAIQINYYDNVGSAESDGIEASMRWITPIPGLVMMFNGGTVDARTTEDFQAGRSAVPAGKPLPGSAKYQYSINFGLFGSPDWTVNTSALLGYTYVGETYNDITSDDVVNDYGTYSASLNLSIPSVTGRPTLALSAFNLTDETTPVGLVKVLYGDDFYILNPPRMITARFSLEF
jgi:iron complex outermembrane receptor protein